MSDARSPQASAEAAPGAVAPPRLRESHLLWGILLLALGVRLLLNLDPVATMLRIYRTPFMDSAAYDIVATNILQGRAFGLAQPDAHLMPLFFYYVAAVYYCFGHSYLALSIANGVVSAVGCLFTYLLGRDLFSRRAGLVAAGLQVFWIKHLRLVPQVLTEPLMIAAVTLAAWWLWRTWQEPSWRRQAVLGVVLGLLLLMRAQAGGFVAAAAILAAAAEPTWGRRARAALLVAAVMTLVLAPWWIRNWLRFGAFIPLSLQAGQVMGWTNTPESKDGLFHPPGDPDEREVALLTRLQGEVARMDPIEAAHAGYRRTLAFVWDHPVTYLKFAAYRLLATFDLLPLGYFSNYITWTTIAKRVATWAFLLLVCVGLLAGRAGAGRAVWLLALVAGFVAPITLVTTNDPRALFPVEPLLLLLGARAAWWLAALRGPGGRVARWAVILEGAAPAAGPARSAWLAGVAGTVVVLAVARVGYGAAGERMRIAPAVGAVRLFDRPCRHPRPDPALGDNTGKPWPGGDRAEIRVYLSSRPAVPREIDPGSLAGDASFPPLAFADRFYLAYRPAGGGGAAYPCAGIPVCISLSGAQVPPDLREEDEVWVDGCLLSQTSRVWIQANEVRRATR